VAEEQHKRHTSIFAMHRTAKLAAGLIWSTAGYYQNTDWAIREFGSYHSEAPFGAAAPYRDQQGWLGRKALTSMKASEDYWAANLRLYSAASTDIDPAVGGGTLLPRYGRFRWKPSRAW